MWKTTEVTRRLGLSVPIVQGPFGGGLSTVELTSIVSNAGGLGSFGVNNLAPGQIGTVVANLRQRTDKPFAVNLWVTNHDADGLHLPREDFVRNAARMKPYFDELGLPLPEYPERFGQVFEEQVGALLEAAPPVFSFIFGVPSPAILAECRARGIATIGTATTVAEAVVLDEAGVDAIVATGFEAGGHRVSFLRSAEASLTGTFALIPQVADRVKAPVIAAGGIADGRGIAAALALGASAVQIGTAFLACDESGTSDLHRAKLHASEPGGTQLTRVLTGRLVRALSNRLIDELTPLTHELPPYPSQGWFVAQLKAAALAQGRSDLLSMLAGQASPLVRHTSADALMKALVAETDEVLAKLGT